jgi:protein-S-isoprenylcysteine O-methyltransferase Ste14
VSWLLARALFAFLVLPGTMGFLVPFLLVESGWRDRPFHFTALAALLPGFSLLVLCVREFYVRGKGTLAPWSPPVHLVMSGPYRFSRNPMYVAMTMLILGWAWAFESATIAWYAVFMILAFHLRILLGEEPRLAREFGGDWLRYRSRVPRWIGRRGQEQNARRARLPV